MTKFKAFSFSPFCLFLVCVCVLKCVCVTEREGKGEIESLGGCRLPLF